MKKYQTNSEQETKNLGRKIAKMYSSKIFALTGDLGAGKTTFVQGFSEGLGIKDKVISPTFVLIRQHPIPKTKKVLYHIDLYRLESVDKQELGLQEILSDPSAIILIEWAEKLKDLPKGSIRISIEKEGNEKRNFSIFTD